MRVMVIVKATKNSEAGLMPSEQLLADMGKFNEELVKAGIMLAGEGLHPSSAGARVRFKGSERTVVDGPFTEAKEVVGGFAILNANSKEEAIEMAKQFLEVAGNDGTCELRLLYDPPTQEINARHQASSIAQQLQAANS